MIRVGVLDTYFPSYNKPYNEDVSVNYIRSQCLLQEVMKEEGVELVRVCVNASSWGSVFSYRGTYTDNEFVVYNESIQVDMLRNRSLFNSALNYLFFDIPILPHPLLSGLSSDKAQQALVFHEFQPTTVLLSAWYRDTELQKSFWEKVVVKPRWWSSGAWVVLWTPDMLLNSKYYKEQSKQHIVQEFLDFSGGIPNLLEGIHDFRIVFLWRDPVFVEIRQPQMEWEFRSNFALGGSDVILSVDSIPSSLLPVCDQILDKLATGIDNMFFCSLDFWYAHDRRYLIEINGSPWIEFEEKDIALQRYIYKQYATYFLSCMS